MFVCMCKGVTDQDIRREIRRGASSVSELSARLELGTQCGGCLSFAQEMLDDSIAPAAANFQLAYSAA